MPLMLASATDTLTGMRRWFWILDALVVISFAIIGREDHGFASEFSDYARVAAPFLVGLGITIVVLRAWRNPESLVTGVLLAIGTLVVGMLLRRFVWDNGTARSFVLVTAAYLTAGMVGWRLVALGARKLMESRAPATS